MPKLMRELDTVYPDWEYLYLARNMADGSIYLDYKLPDTCAQCLSVLDCGNRKFKSEGGKGVPSYEIIKGPDFSNIRIQD